MPNSTMAVAITRMILLIISAVSRLMKPASERVLNVGPRHANSSKGRPVATSRIHRIKTPRDGSDAKLCTEVSRPDLTMNVPTSDSEKARMASNMVQLFN